MQNHQASIRPFTIGTMLIGLVFAAAGVLPHALPLEWFFSLLFWPEPPTGNLASFARLGAAMTGGLLVGMGVTIDAVMRLSSRPDRHALAGALLKGVFAWFVVDSVASVLVGASLNVIGNTAFLAFVSFPLWSLQRAHPAEQA